MWVAFQLVSSSRSPEPVGLAVYDHVVLLAFTSATRHHHRGELPANLEAAGRDWVPPNKVVVLRDRLHSLNAPPGITALSGSQLARVNPTGGGT